MIVLHLLQLNGSVNYYRKWKLISSEVGVKLKNEENSKFSKKIIKKSKIVVQTYWTHVRPVHPPVGAPVDRYSADNRYSMEWRYTDYQWILKRRPPSLDNLSTHEDQSTGISAYMTDDDDDAFVVEVQ